MTEKMLSDTEIFADAHPEMPLTNLIRDLTKEIRRAWAEIERLKKMEAKFEHLIRDVEDDGGVYYRPVREIIASWDG